MSTPPAREKSEDLRKKEGVTDVSVLKSSTTSDPSKDETTESAETKGMSLVEIGISESTSSIDIQRDRRTLISKSKLDETLSDPAQIEWYTTFGKKMVEKVESVELLELSPESIAEKPREETPIRYERKREITMSGIARVEAPKSSPMNDLTSVKQSTTRTKNIESRPILKYATSPPREATLKQPGSSQKSKKSPRPATFPDFSFLSSGNNDAQLPLRPAIIGTKLGVFLLICTEIVLSFLRFHDFYSLTFGRKLRKSPTIIEVFNVSWLCSIGICVLCVVFGWTSDSYTKKYFTLLTAVGTMVLVSFTQVTFHLTPYRSLSNKFIPYIKHIVSSTTEPLLQSVVADQLSRHEASKSYVGVVFYTVLAAHTGECLYMMYFKFTRIYSKVDIFYFNVASLVLYLFAFCVLCLVKNYIHHEKIWFKIVDITLKQISRTVLITVAAQFGKDARKFCKDIEDKKLRAYVQLFSGKMCALLFLLFMMTSYYLSQFLVYIFVKIFLPAMSGDIQHHDEITASITIYMTIVNLVFIVFCMNPCLKTIKPNVAIDLKNFSLVFLLSVIMIVSLLPLAYVMDSKLVLPNERISIFNKAPSTALAHIELGNDQSPTGSYWKPIPVNSFISIVPKKKHTVKLIINSNNQIDVYEERNFIGYLTYLLSDKIRHVKHILHVSYLSNMVLICIICNMDNCKKQRLSLKKNNEPEILKKMNSKSFDIGAGAYDVKLIGEQKNETQTLLKQYHFLPFRAMYLFVYNTTADKIKADVNYFHEVKTLNKLTLLPFTILLAFNWPLIRYTMFKFLLFHSPIKLRAFTFCLAYAFHKFADVVLLIGFNTWHRKSMETSHIAVYATVHACVFFTFIYLLVSDNFKWTKQELEGDDRPSQQEMNEKQRSKKTIKINKY